MLNHITIMGRLTRDPELRYTQTQTPVASFTLAVDRDYSNRDTNERQTDFIDCVACSVVSGRLQLRDWTDKDGNKRRNAEVVVDNIYFGESRRRDAESSSQFSTPYSNDYPSQSASSLAPSEFEELSEDDGELPF